MALLNQALRRAGFGIAGLLLANAAAAGGLEYQVKAVFLLHFAQFVEWPDTAFADRRSPLTICILGEDPFDGVLDDIVRGETVGDRSFRVFRLKTPEETAACHILYISDSESARRRRDLDLIRNRSVLTVGDGNGFGDDGGMVAFTLVDDKIRLLINPDAAKAAKLKLSSKLLQVAQLATPAER